MPKLAIIVGSVRPNRFADHPTKWIYEHVVKRGDFDAEILDLRDYPMPFFEEASSPAYATSENETARRWQEKIDAFDAYLVIAAEYNRGPTAVLKNALDYAYKEYNNKPVAFVGYGGVGGARAIEQLRLHAVELQMAPIRNAVHIQMPVYMAVVKEGKDIAGFDFLNEGADQMLDQLMWWTRALETARKGGR